MKKITCFAVLVSLTFGMTTMSVAGQVPQTEFVFNLYRTVIKDKSDENVAVSPYGVQQLLDIVRHGAAGQTQTEIEKVLGYTKSVKWETLSDSTLTTATAMWTQQGYSIRPSFLQTARTNFDVSVEQADFTNAPDAAVKRINAWVSAKTKEKIPTILDELNPDTRLVLVNAIHFAADWEIPFDEYRTKDADFTLQDGTKVETQIMGLWERMKYGENADTLILELPYKAGGRTQNRFPRLRQILSRGAQSGSDYAMLLLLPKDPAAFAKWESTMTIEKWNALRRTMKMEDVDMCMPRFTMESNIELIEPLKQLGISTAFDREKADFSKINDSKELYVGQALQKTFIKVDETGTEATAVTTEPMDLVSAEPEPLPPPKEFYADRPFLFAIVKGNSILFFGRFVKPEAE